MKIKLQRAMCFAAKPVAVGTELEVPDALARELIAQGRATVAAGVEPPPPPTGPMTTESAAPIVKSTDKGKAHARS